MTKDGAKIKVHLLFLPLLWQLPEAKVRLLSLACFAPKKSVFAIVFFPSSYVPGNYKKWGLFTENLC